MGWWVTGSADTGCTLPDVGHSRRRCATMGRRLYDPLREFVAGPRGGMGDVHNSARPSVDGTTPATRPWPRSKGLPASEAVSRLVVTDPDWGPSWRPSPWRAEGVGSAQTRPNTPTTVTTTHRKAPSNVTRDGRRPGTLRTVVEPLPAGVVPALVSRGIRTTTTPPVIHTRGVERLIGRPHCQTRSSHMLAPAALTPGLTPAGYVHIPPAAAWMGRLPVHAGACLNWLSSTQSLHPHPRTRGWDLGLPRPERLKSYQSYGVWVRPALLHTAHVVPTRTPRAIES